MFTYDPALSTARDRIRNLVGDTDASNPLRDDATIDAAIAQYGEGMAAAVIAEGLAAEYARRPSSFGTTGLSINWGARVSTWLELASRYRSGGGDATTASVLRASRSETLDAEYVRAGLDRPGRHDWYDE